ncbi:MAG TPA: substrate-binding domain-containing protein [Kiritimatiellia bacterium]|nr:substrate-binding domain-containing protein [Kiritimatiellia bacterium]
MKTLRHILVMQPWLHRLAHEILYGVNDYFSESSRRQVEVTRLTWDWSSISAAAEWHCDGLIAPVLNQVEHDRVKALRWRCVSTYGGARWHGIPTVDANHYATGVMAADHLLGQGYESFAYIGDRNLTALNERHRGFLDTLARKGKSAISFEYRLFLHIDERNRKEWTRRLKSLPKPCGVYCSDDQTARVIAWLARAGGISVPDEIALLGTQNDEGLCRGMNPPLSSVEIPYRQVGYEAARLMDQWWSLGKAPVSPPAIPPSHVAVRASTQALAVEDENLRVAIRHLRGHYAEKISMSEVARTAGLSLRNLQRRFQQKLGHTPQTELQHIRIHRVKELLRETNLTLEAIAGQCGYLSANYLCEQFRRATGLSPGAYRARNRERGPHAAPPA